MRRLLLLIATLITAPAFGKSLYWDSLDVTAHLDAAGALHVLERQTIVFDGDWNGGERTFRLRLNQALHFNGMTRVDESGRETPLVRGDLSKVDHYDFATATVVRWRSRLPSDPPFQNSRITYILDYMLNNVLLSEGDRRYTLDHDFAFPDRQGAINTFSLDLTFDPAWDATPVRLTRGTIPPGVSFVVTRQLAFRGAAPPDAIRLIPSWVGPVAAAALIATMVLLLALFRRAEAPTGRFAEVIPPEKIDEPWLRTHLLAMKPEVAGASWDDAIGAPEVAAVLARLTAEGRLTSRVEKKTLHLHRNQPIEQFSGYERALLDKLFFDSSPDTDTNRVKAHYKNRGFDPARVITKGIESQMSALPERKKKIKRINWRDILSMFAVSAIVLIIGGFRSTADAADAAVAAGVIVFFTAFASGVAYSFRSALTGIGGRILLVALLFLPALAATLVSCFLSQKIGIGPLTVVGVVAFAIAGWKTALDTLKITDSPEYIAFRKNLIAARNYFVMQLRSAQPHLHDDWLPYLLAFGLGSNVDRWFRSFGGASSSSAFGSTTSTSGSSSTSSSSSGWTGGGGAFGGAGATGSWALAAGALAAGVSAPSSSGGGGGGGGGGSSGGGGGGGW